MKKIFRTALCEFLAVIIMWGCLTNGWQPAKLAPWPRAVLILTVIGIIETDIIVVLARQVYMQRLTGNKEYIGFVKKFEDRYFDMVEETVQLRRDLAAEQGKSEVQSIYMGALTDKPTFSGAKIVDSTTGKLTSADGLTREEKERRAYSLHVDGWSTAEIAEELGIGSGSVRVYISRGKKSYDRQGDDAHYDWDAERMMYHYHDMHPEDTSEAYKEKRAAEKEKDKKDEDAEE